MATVFTNGCFDIITVAHINLLWHCRTLAGDSGKVIVAIDEDEKIQRDKGLRRPIFDVHERAKAILDLKMVNPLVDQVEFFHTDFELGELVKKISPDFLVKGGDWRDKYVAGSHYAKVVFYDRMELYSTTEIIRRVVEKNKLI